MQALWSSSDATTGVATFLATSHPGYASHTSSTGTASNGVAAQGEAQATWVDTVPEHQGQADAGSGSGTQGTGSATMQVRKGCIGRPERRQKAGTSLEAGHAHAQ